LHHLSSALKIMPTDQEETKTESDILYTLYSEETADDQQEQLEFDDASY
jgi:hypothetical protein